MIWGSQWDVMVSFIGDHTITKPGVRKLTGNYGDEYKHVHDTSTGLYDWTAAAYHTSARAYRGGRYNYTYSASHRDYYLPTSTFGDFGSRPQLYIK